MLKDVFGKMPKLKKVLHHYTSGNGLIGIFENSSIWATQIHFMNDAKEFSLAIEMALNFLRKHESKTKKQIAKTVKTFLKVRLRRMSGISFYVACFSEVGDSLSQWRGYCPSSFGYCVGFNFSRLEEIANAQGFMLKACIYKQKEQQQLVEKWAIESMSSIIKEYSQDLDQDLWEFLKNNANKYLEDFAYIAPFMKDRAFKDEREWRLVSLIKSSDPRVKLRPGKSMLIPYVNIDLNLRDEEELIWDIRVGPTPQIDLALNAITHLLRRATIKNGVTRTTIPYRDW